MTKTYSEISAAGGASLVLFTSATCGPCKLMKPRLVALAAEKGLELHVLDIAYEMDHVRALGIRGVPSLVVVEPGRQEVLFTGALSDEQVLAKLQQKGILA